MFDGGELMRKPLLAMQAFASVDPRKLAPAVLQSILKGMPATAGIFRVFPCRVRRASEPRNSNKISNNTTTPATKLTQSGLVVRNLNTPYSLF